MRQFSLDDYRTAVADYETNWSAIDRELYDLCRRYPGHSDPSGLNATLWIIGRTYATGIERKIKTQGTQGSSLTQLSLLLHRRGLEVDQLIEDLVKNCGPLTAAKLGKIISCHGRFLNVLKEITRTAQTTRSFASKYLHFHCPTVPIIDSYVAGILPKLVRWQSALHVFDMPEHGDDYYAWYVMRFWSLFQTAADAIQKHGSKQDVQQLLTVKHLDYYLIWLCNQSRSIRPAL